MDNYCEIVIYTENKKTLLAINCIFAYLWQSPHPLTTVHGGVHKLGSCSLTQIILLCQQQQKRV